MSTAGDDPRDASAETKFAFPESWKTDAPDGLSAAVMFISGLIMVTRNRYLAWPNLLLTLNCLFNQHPLRTKEGQSNATSGLMIGCSALVASYLPLIMPGPQRTQTQTPLPVPQATP